MKQAGIVLSQGELESDATKAFEKFPEALVYATVHGQG